MRRAIFTLLVIAATQAYAQDVYQLQLAERTVGLRLVKADTLAPVAWPDEKIALEQESALITVNQNVYMLLQGNGVAPDSEAFAIVYDLNPEIKDVGSLSPNTKVQLPKVVGGPQIRALLQNGTLTEFVVDPELRNDLNESIASLRTLSPQINQLSSQSQTQQQIQSLLQWFDNIEKRFKRRTDPPLSHTTLLQMRDEARLLQSILVTASQQQKEITPGGAQQISAIYEDVKLEMNEYGQSLAGVAPKAESSYQVTVKIKGADEKYISGLRVYYILNGLFPPPPQHPPETSLGFRNLGSSQSETLLQKNYRLWAAKDGDANHPVTPPYLLHIEAGAVSPLQVDLSLTNDTKK